MKDLSDIKTKPIENDKAQGDAYIGRDDKLDEYFSENKEAKADPVFIPTESQYKPKGLARFFSYTARLAVIFILGGAGGVWMEHNVIPVLATKAPFEKYSFFKEIKNRTVIINRTEEIKISEDAALLEAVRKANPSLVKITANYVFQEKPPTGKKKAPVVPKTKVEAKTLNGVIVTGDGLVLTRDPRIFSADLSKFDLKEVNYGIDYQGKEFVVQDIKEIDKEEDISFFNLKVKNTDPRKDIVLLRIKANNLPVISMADASDIELGQKTIALGNSLFSGVISEINRFDSDLTTINIDNAPQPDYFGSGPLINLKGELLGINIIDGQGKPTNSFIAVNDLRSFINLVIQGYHR